MDNSTNNVATSKAQLFTVFLIDKEEYAASVDNIIEIVENLPITPVPESLDYVLGIINLRGKIIPIIDLEKKFGLVHESEVNFKHILIAEVNKTLFAIRVEEVKEVVKLREEDIKPVPSTVASKISGDYLKGVFIEDYRQTNGEKKEEMRDPRIILVLDFQKIFSLEDLHKPIDAVNTDTAKTEGGVMDENANS